MNTFLGFFIAFMLITQQLLPNDMYLEGRVSGFYPTQKLMREIYGNWLAEYEIEFGMPVYPFPSWQAWGNVNYVSSHGHTREFDTRTELENTNFGFGAKYLMGINSCTLCYLGAGLNCAFVLVHNKSPYVKRHVYKTGFGGIFKAGVSVEPIDHLFFEAFVDYLYQPMDFQTHAQIGGYKFGGGIGYRF